GTEASVYAIKQFAYLFPELCNQETTLLYANQKEDDLPERDRMSELAARHYTNLTLQKLEMPEPRKFFHEWIGERSGNNILISGSFARSGLSESIKRSFIYETIADHKVPAFIAHR
ncbi:MAG: hypothetical protein ACM3H8_00440, partial [Sphingobacteriales bacterium]